MNKFTLTLTAKGFIDQEDETISTPNCTLQLSFDQSASEDVALQVRTHILSEVLSDFVGFNVMDVLKQHIEIRDAINYKNPLK